MTEFIYNIYYGPRCKMSKLYALSRRLEEEKSEMDAHFFDKGQLQNEKNDNIRELANADNVELEVVYVATWEKQNGL